MVMSFWKASRSAYRRIIPRWPMQLLLFSPAPPLSHKGREVNGQTAKANSKWVYPHSFTHHHPTTSIFTFANRQDRSPQVLPARAPAHFPWTFWSSEGAPASSAPWIWRRTVPANGRTFDSPGQGQHTGSWTRRSNKGKWRGHIKGHTNIGWIHTWRIKRFVWQVRGLVQQTHKHLYNNPGRTKSFPPPNVYIISNGDYLWKNNSH